MKTHPTIQERKTATYPLGPHQEQGNPLWYQSSVFQPWNDPATSSPFWGMAMYGGFVEADSPQWVPSYQPGMLASGINQRLPMYSGFVNEQSMKGI